MFDLDYIVNDDELVLDFIKDDNDKYRAIDRLTGELRGSVTINGCTFDASDDYVFMQYKLWLSRPERAVGKKACIEGLTLSELQEVYEELLIGSYILLNCSRFVPLNNIKPNYTQMIHWLRSTDFYTAPASTQYHDSNPGGLLVHSLKVYNSMLDLLHTDVFKDVSIAEATVVSLVHDWCKIGFYEIYYRNVKNKVTGTWEELPCYRYNPKGVTLGHGVTSLYLASKCFSLTPEMASAIRWHMGEYNVAPNELNELHDSNSKYPICYLIQFADRIACTDWVGNKIL